MNKARYLLRVSSNQQLDSDGDLTVQRKIVRDYIATHEDWELDDEKKVEYFEPGVSGYKIPIEKRDVLNKIKGDAKKREFDILVCYKDDRLGRREDEVPKYIKELAEYGVLIYSVKDGLITPLNHTEDLLTFIRYWHSQGSSLDTSQRVRDNAKKLVATGKFLGGKAPYGYELVLSGELSKHQRALKKLRIVPQKAEMVKMIYHMAIRKGYGSLKIAKKCNEVEKYKELAPNGYIWKAETVRSILMNPIYAGYTAYARREHNGSQYKRLDRKDWIYAEECNEEIKMIEIETWEKAQQIREARKERIKDGHQRPDNVPQDTRGALALIDVVYCGYCGRKLTNGSKYNYWTTKSGEKRCSIVGYYRCQSKAQGEICSGRGVCRADNIEPIIFNFVKEYLTSLEDRETLVEKLKDAHLKQFDEKQKELNKLRKRLQDARTDIETMQEVLPKVLRGEIGLSVDLFHSQLEKKQEKEKHLLEQIAILKESAQDKKKETDELDNFSNRIPLWKEIFDGADVADKRIMINKLIEQIDVKAEGVNVKLRVSLDSLLSRITTGFPVS